MSRKTELTKTKKGIKIHPHNHCAICSKPKRYKAKTKLAEMLKESRTS